MKVESIKSVLKDALLIADRVAGKHLSLPVLSQTLFLASENGITLRATNLDLGVEITVPAKVAVEGAIAVPGAVLGNYLALIQNERDVVIELVGQNLAVTSGKHSTIIKCLPYEDFPSIPLIDRGAHASLDVRSLVIGMRSVIFSASLSDIKPEFASIYFFSDSGYLTLAATDSSRLSEKRVPTKRIDDGISFLLPIKNASEIIRILDATEGIVDVYVSGNQASFIIKNIHITSRLIDGLFPDYRQVIPKTIIAQATVLRDDLIHALKIANIFSGKLQQMRLVIDPKEHRFEVGARSDDVGETMTEVDAKLSGERVDLVFNQRFIADVLQIIPQDSVTLQSGGIGKPLIIRGTGEQGYLYLVMPMRIS